MTTEQDRVSADELNKLTQGKELSGEIRSVLALKELQQLRGVLAEVREILALMSDGEGPDADIYMSMAKDALKLIDSLDVTACG